jgi:transposase
MTAAAPEDIAALKARLAATEAALAERDAALAEMAEANRRLEQMIAELRREKFGPRSEKLSPDQYNLPLEDVEIAQGVLQAAQEKADATLKASRSKGERVKRNRKPLPPGLPEIERVIEPASTLCPCGCGEMARIGEDVSRRLDVIPAQFRVLVTRRPKYACRRCSSAVVQAHAPEHVVPGGLPTEALIAHVIASKFADHLPLYRQAEIFRRQGVDIDRAVHEQPLCAGEMGAHPLDDGLEVEAGAADPVAQGGAVDVDALAAEDLGLPVQGQVIGELANDDMGDERLGR